ncbi:FecR family protein [Dysgonomonas sp. Marseille-P4677]|uniref:FecR family protein n=1 Tax=Dysgonomonas sp. Marseille-P4677 TaxID=2364790 RepID=UPI0019121996|nr:FecR family protein [Dysgonomonas sp. Marseille-P4677]MBK5721824.1 FecR family protein [Dysgonomonas sp. Marseille-P4677]
MNKECVNYGVEDLLHNDLFLQSVFHSTPITDLYWEKLIQENKLSEEVYNQAKAFVLKMNECENPDVDENLHLLWNRISETNKKKKKLITTYSIAIGMAACILGIVILLNFNSKEKQDSILFASDYDFNTIERVAPSNNIQVVINDIKITLNSDEAVINHTKDGNTKINDDTIILPNKKAHANLNQLIVPYGKRSRLQLIDGSIIWVNAGTRVVYPEEFTGNKREIYVDGEIYADIFHDAKRPFIVRSNDMSVQVLGTKFDIAVHDNEPNKFVVLVEGSVKVLMKRGNPSGIILSPNQLLLVSPTDNSITTVNTSNYTSWIDGVYKFRQTSLEMILMRLSKYYGVKIECEEIVSKLTCSGSLDLKDDLSSVLQDLSLATSLKYQYEEGIYKFREVKP